ncbi:MAG: hypothetical protein ACUVQR_10910 [Thermogutta sp.]
MKTKLFLGALMISAMLCGRGFGADMFGRMVSLDEGCAACAQPAPACEPCAQVKRCDLFAGLKDLLACRRCAPACEEACESAKCAVPEPACEPACANPCWPQPVRALLRGVRNALACPVCGQAECNACEPARETPACEPAREPACGPICRLHKRIACEACAPACEKPACEPAREPACEPSCECGRRPVLNFLRNLLGCDRNVSAVSKCGCGVEAAPAEKGGKAAPAPLPAAPSPNA